MTDTREIAADVSFEHLPYLLRHDLHAQSLQRVVRISARPKAVTAIQEICFEHGFQNARYRSLQQPVPGRWNSKRSGSDFARPFGYINSADRRCMVGAFLQMFADPLDLRFQLLSKLLSTLPIDAACCFPVHLSPSLLEKFRRQQVRQ